uniref:Uncharacterized protein n=1 Tax=Arundo donax TaxID=35708 RepID=A0A0A9G4J1_ARUDO
MCSFPTFSCLSTIAFSNIVCKRKKGCYALSFRPDCFSNLYQ